MTNTARTDIDFSHLNALELSRGHEVGRIARATTEGEKKLRNVWLTQIEDEITRERDFLGLPTEDNEPSMSIDEILAELDAI